MNSEESKDNLLDRYLDRLLSEQETAEFLQGVDPDQLKQTEQLQSRIDSSLRRMLSGLEVDQQQVEERFLLSGDGKLSGSKTVVSTGMPNSHLMKTALAAMLLVAASLAIWFNLQPRTVEPIVAYRPLTEVYAEKLLDFRPYYVCDDDKRFAETFANKLGIALALGDLPPDRKMTGLSYLGGISRDTVAMLCEVQGEEVIVFVDHEDADGIEVAIKSTNPDLNVFVKRKFGLVFVEVTPLPSTMMIDSFELLE
jgi:hypothetical protein